MEEILLDCNCVYSAWKTIKLFSFPTSPCKRKQLVKFVDESGENGKFVCIFQVSRPTIGNIRRKILNWFYDSVKHHISLQSLEWRLLNSVKLFYTTYTFILDGSEQFCNRPANAFL